MRIIGVIDIQDGRAVHARGGRRADYGSVAVAAGVRVDGDPARLARAYIARLGVRELYVADLDAIERRRSVKDGAVVRDVASCGAPTWVDAGVATVAGARDLRELGASRVVVGLETLVSFAALRDICAEGVAETIAFSLDLRDSVPITMPNDASPGASAVDIAVRAADAGVGAVIVLDLARVGTGAGIDFRLVERVRRAVPGVTLVAGGGVRDDVEVDRLASAGCDAVLVATALLTAKVTAR